MTSAPRSRSFIRSWRLAVAAATITSVAVATVPAGAEPNFGGVKFLPALAGTSLVNLPAYGSISCVASTCTAVGGSNNAFGNEGGKAAIITENAGTWSAPIGVTFPGDHVVPTTGDGFSDALLKVSCWQVGDCVAVGQYGVSKNFGVPAGDLTVSTPMVMTETSGTWSSASALALPVLADSLGGPTGLSCDASGHCSVVGYYATIDEATGNPTFHGFFANNNAGPWTAAVDTPAVPGTPSVIAPTGISCADSTDCTATIAAKFATTDTTYRITETAGVWGSAVALAPPTGRVFEGMAISCPSATGCIVVGQSSSSAHNLDNNLHLVPAFSVEHAGTWGAAGQLPQPMLSPVTGGGVFGAITCSGSSMCEAVGAATTGATGLGAIPMAATWNGTKWSSLGLYNALLHAGSATATASNFLDVSCTSTTSCTTLGFTGTGTINSSNVPYFAFSTGINPTMSVAAPSSPVGLKAALAPKTATISWQPPYSDGGSSVTSFLVTATSPGLAKKLCLSTTLSCKLTGVAKGHAYHVSIQSRNGVGFSKPSLVLTFVGH